MPCRTQHSCSLWLVSAPSSADNNSLQNVGMNSIVHQPLIETFPLFLFNSCSSSSHWHVSSVCNFVYQQMWLQFWQSKSNVVSNNCWRNCCVLLLLLKVRVGKRGDRLFSCLFWFDIYLISFFLCWICCRKKDNIIISETTILLIQWLNCSRCNAEWTGHTILLYGP